MEVALPAVQRTRKANPPPPKNAAKKEHDQCGSMASSDSNAITQYIHGMAESSNPQTKGGTLTRSAAVRYYVNALQRIHSSYQELTTGQTFLSPFGRSDARFRR